MDEIENIQPIEQPIENIEPTWQDVEEGKVNFQELPKQLKQKVKQEAYEQTPEDKKYLWDDYGYTPPQTYKGVDRNGKQVEGLDQQGFEELVKKGRIKQKTKIEEDVEKLTNVVKEQSKLIVSHQETELNKKISELKEKGLYEDEDFKEYEKLLVEKNSIDFQKLELNKQDLQNEKQSLSLDEQADVQLFQYQNRLFIETVKKDPQLIKFFDEQALTLKNRNPNASLVDIMNAAKKITENAFNPKKQIFMHQNIERTETKTNLNQKPEFKISYNNLNDSSKIWINSAAKAGNFKGVSLIGKSLDEITTIIYKSINSKNEK